MMKIFTPGHLSIFLLYEVQKHLVKIVGLYLHVNYRTELWF